MARVLQPCGTPAAYQRHRRHYEMPCQACTDAERERSAAYRAEVAAILAAARERAAAAQRETALAAQRRADLAAAVYADKRRLPARIGAALRGEL